jgi:hypothetical protein
MMNSLAMYVPRPGSLAARLHREHCERRARLSPRPTEPKRPNVSAETALAAPFAPKVPYGESVIIITKPVADADKQAAMLAPSMIKIIQRECARQFNVNVADLKSPRRTAYLAFARQVAMYITKTLTQKSLPEIGRRFGGRDHTTVLHAVRKIENLIKSDDDFALQAEAIEHRVKEIYTGAAIAAVGTASIDHKQKSIFVSGVAISAAHSAGNTNRRG